MKRAMCLIRAEPHYRKEAFITGLRKAGYMIIEKGMADGPTDVLVIWNRYGANGSMADIWERNGGTVFVAENGYLGADPNGIQYYAVSVRGHNGSGHWPLGGRERFEALHVNLEPWKKQEGYSLVCGQRGIGSPLMASPPDWHKKVETRLKALEKNQPIKIRLHPGNHHAPSVIPSLKADLEQARDCVIWSSSSGVKALAMGYPVRYDAPHWICAEGASRIGEPLKYNDDARLSAMCSMAWAQWSIRELETGEPFKRLSEVAIMPAGA